MIVYLLFLLWSIIKCTAKNIPTNLSPTSAPIVSSSSFSSMPYRTLCHLRLRTYQITLPQGIISFLWKRQGYLHPIQSKNERSDRAHWTRQNMASTFSIDLEQHLSWYRWQKEECQRNSLKSKRRLPCPGQQTFRWTWNKNKLRNRQLNQKKFTSLSLQTWNLEYPHAKINEQSSTLQQGSLINKILGNCQNCWRWSVSQ